MSGKIIVPLEDRGFLIAYEGVLPHKLPAPEASDLLFKESGVRSQNLAGRQTTKLANSLDSPTSPSFSLAPTRIQSLGVNWKMGRFARV